MGWVVEMVAVPLGQSGDSSVQILIWVLALIVLIVVGGLVIFAIRRKLLAKDPLGGHESGLMDQMRAMHSSGELSTEEYDRIRKRLAARAAGKDPEVFGIVKSGTSRDPSRGSSRGATSQSESQSASTEKKSGREEEAKPGFDLTGDRLPTRAEPEEPLGESENPEAGHDPDGFPETPWPETSE